MKKIFLVLCLAISWTNYARADDSDNLVLTNLSTNEILDYMVCGHDFNSEFCDLLYVYDSYRDFDKFLNRCAPDMSVDEIYGRAFFACNEHAYHRQNVGVLSHLSIRFGEFGGQMTAIARIYRDQKRLEEFEALLNKQDAKRRTFLDIFADAVESGERIGAGSRKFNQSIIKNVCRFGGRHNTRSHPASCKRNDKLFTMSR